TGGQQVEGGEKRKRPRAVEPADGARRGSRRPSHRLSAGSAFPGAGGSSEDAGRHGPDGRRAFGPAALAADDPLVLAVDGPGRKPPTGVARAPAANRKQQALAPIVTTS